MNEHKRVRRCRAHHLTQANRRHIPKNKNWLKEKILY